MGRVLLLEPYEEIRNLVAAIMRRAGHEVVLVLDGNGAVEAMEREYFSCVVVGAPVTVHAGGEKVMFLEYIERHCPEWRPCMIVMTSYVDSMSVLSVAQRLDVCAVFAKPFSAPELMAAMDECFAGRRPSQRWYGFPETLVAQLEA